MNSTLPRGHIYITDDDGEIMLVEPSHSKPSWEVVDRTETQNRFVGTGLKQTLQIVKRLKLFTATQT